MKEELITSGRMNYKIDPTLHIWGWEIPIYLFLGGLAAGVLFFAALYYLRGKENEYQSAVKWVPMLTPFLLAIGLGALFLDLHHKPYFWRLYTTIKIQSPMSWGAWTLMVITPLSMVWSATYVRELFPKWDWKFKWIYGLEAFFTKNRTSLAWIMIVFATILGIYTGILLSAFNARPLWNTSILGPLFLVSGLSTGLATIMWMSNSHYERSVLSKIDIHVARLLFMFIFCFH